MKKWMGQNIAIYVFILAIIAILVLVFVPVLNSTVYTSNVQAATNFLEGRGYTVLSSDQYAAIAKEATAAVAVMNAQNAVTAAELAAAKVDLFNSAEVFLFPATTDLTVNLMAGDTNVWSAWTEVADTVATKLSSVFATKAGYVTDMYIYDHSAVDKLYAVELAYGDAKSTLARVMYHTAYKDMTPIESQRVPAGELIYYRMMCSGADHATAEVGFRYIYE